MINSFRLGKNKFLTLDTYCRQDYPTNTMHFFQSFLSIIAGIGIGTLLTVAAQKEINKHVETTCYGPADQIAPVRSFMGTVKYCVKGGIKQ
jgi:hypothetical protein